MHIRSSPLTRKKRDTASRFLWKEHFSLSADEKLGGPEKCVKISDLNGRTNKLKLILKKFFSQFLVLNGQYVEYRLRIQKDFRTAPKYTAHHCQTNPLPKTVSTNGVESQIVYLVNVWGCAETLPRILTRITKMALWLNINHKLYG